MKNLSCQDISSEREWERVRVCVRDSERVRESERQWETVCEREREIMCAAKFSELEWARRNWMREPHRLCISVCVCVSVWACERVCECVSMWACECVSMWACECVSMWACVCVSVWACVCVCEREREIREFGTNGLFFQASLGCETPRRRGRRWTVTLNLPPPPFKFSLSNFFFHFSPSR